MGAAFAHSGAKTESHDNFGALFGHVKAQSERVSTAFRERTVKTVDFTRRTCFKEGENGSFGGKVMATVFWASHGNIFND